jgi:hypothetical protein
MTENDESDLPDKPPIEDMPPEEGIEPPSDAEEEKATLNEGEDPSAPEEDDRNESMGPRHADLPEGADRSDYEDEG